jgi:hypothetical protein
MKKFPGKCLTIGWFMSYSYGVESENRKQILNRRIEMAVASIPSAVKVKDDLLTAMNSKDTMESMVEFCKTTLIPILTHTEGFWVELDYCYKAAEIAARAKAEIESYLWDATHWKTQNMLENVRSDLGNLECRYQTLQG